MAIGTAVYIYMYINFLVFQIYLSIYIINAYIALSLVGILFYSRVAHEQNYSIFIEIILI